VGREVEREVGREAAVSWRRRRLCLTGVAGTWVVAGVAGGGNCSHGCSTQPDDC